MNIKDQTYVYIALAGVLLLAVVAGIAYVLSIPEAPETTPFDETGVVTMDNPGLTPGVLHLVYEEPGAPALTTALQFDGESSCERAGEPIACKQQSFTSGDRVRVQGGQIGDVVHVDRLTALESTDAQNVIVNQPERSASVRSPLTVSGEARGTWFFEADFPVELRNQNNELLAQGVASTTEDWMTESFVPFEVTLNFDAPNESQMGTVILRKDNPSGLPEQDDQVEIPVMILAEEAQTVQLYYYNPELDMDEQGTILCSSQGLVSVERQISSDDVIRATIEALLKGDLTSEEEAAGTETEFPLESVELIESQLSDGTLTLTFEDPLGNTSGGSCRAGILWSQIRATAEQFDEVDEVQFEPEELFQP